MTKTDTSSNNLTPDPAEHIEILDPSQYSLQVIVDENGKEKISFLIHCSPRQAALRPLKVFKDASGNYSVGFVVTEQAKSSPDDNWKSL